MVMTQKKRQRAIHMYVISLRIIDAIRNNCLIGTELYRIYKCLKSIFFTLDSPQKWKKVKCFFFYIFFWKNHLTYLWMNFEKKWLLCNSISIMVLLSITSTQMIKGNSAHPFHDRYLAFSAREHSIQIIYGPLKWCRQQ